MAQGVPTKVVGRALYDLPGITDQQAMADFLQYPAPPEAGAYERFAAALWSECLLNAGFHSDPGLRLLADRAADRLLGVTR